MVAPLNTTDLPFVAHCEMPDENGNPECGRPARNVIKIVNTEEEFIVCDQCLAYREKEARANTRRDR